MYSAGPLNEIYIAEQDCFGDPGGQAEQLSWKYPAKKRKKAK